MTSCRLQMSSRWSTSTGDPIAGLTDAQLSGWGCSVHEAFDNWPADFLVLAIAKDIGTVFTATDGTIGTPYILARGKDLRARGLSLSPSTATNPVGSTHTVTANLRDAEDNPVAGSLIGFQVLPGSVNAGATGTCEPEGCTTDADGKTHERVVSPIDVDGQLFVAANHWPRAWYHRALENPDVSVTRNGETTDYRAVPVSKEERERLLDESGFPLVAYVFTGFAPRQFLRVDPR